MEKKAIVQPGITPDTEKKLQPGEKQAGNKAATQALDDDLTHRLADRVAKPQKRGDESS